MHRSWCAFNVLKYESRGVYTGLILEPVKGHQRWTTTLATLGKGKAGVFLLMKIFCTMLIHIGLWWSMKSAKSFVVLRVFPLGRGFHIHTIIHQHERGPRWLFVHTLHVSLANLTQDRNENEQRTRFDHLNWMLLILKHITPSGTTHRTSIKKIKLKKSYLVKYLCGYRFPKQKVHNICGPQYMQYQWSSVGYAKPHRTTLYTEQAGVCIFFLSLLFVLVSEAVGKLWV